MGYNELLSALYDMANDIETHRKDAKYKYKHKYKSIRDAYLAARLDEVGAIFDAYNGDYGDIERAINRVVESRGSTLDSYFLRELRILCRIKAAGSVFGKTIQGASNDP